MARTIHQIKKELETLEGNVASLAVELREIYQRYLSSLGKSATRQFILACYHICTRCYPQAFLNLSVSQRENLQQNLQTIGAKIEKNLLFCLTNNSLEEAENNTALDTKKESLFNSGPIEEAKMDRPLSEEKSVQNIKNKSFNPNDPENVINWYSRIQLKINESLIEVSKETNRLLATKGIFPQKFPDQLFELALQAEEKSSSVVGNPNLLNLLIEKSKEVESEPKRVDKVTAIKLRLSEIEFADPNLDRERGQIRNLLSKLEKIREQYRNAQRECAIAEAEAAWRAVWHEQ
jgi:hypothetical protein